jgi:uncharacterized protein (TIGR01777 family)
VKVVIAGASGFLGRAIAGELIAHGNRVTTLVRRPPRSATEIEWHPDRGELDRTGLAGADAVISLTGVGIGNKRWTSQYKAEIRDSRLQPTSTIADALAQLDDSQRPATFLSASAIGYYGQRGDQPLPETATAGTGFLAELARDWELATTPAAESGVRVITLRTGLPLAASGGLLKRLIPIFKLGLGGRLGSGKQYQSWISLADYRAAVRHVLTAHAISGPVNIVGPEPARNDEFSRVLATVLHRPAMIPAPAFGLRLVLGEFADEGVLASQRVIPEVLRSTGFQYEHSELPAALNWAVRH